MKKVVIYKRQNAKNNENSRQFPCFSHSLAFDWAGISQLNRYSNINLYENIEIQICNIDMKYKI